MDLRSAFLFFLSSGEARQEPTFSTLLLLSPDGTGVPDGSRCTTRQDFGVFCT